MRLKSSLYRGDKIISGEMKECLYDWGVHTENREGFMKKYNAAFSGNNPSVYEFEKWIRSQENADCRIAWQAIQNAPTK